MKIIKGGINNGAGSNNIWTHQRVAESRARTL